VRYFDDRGVRIRDVTLHGVNSFPLQALQPFSPGGHLAAFTHVGKIQIVDLRSGRIVRPNVAGAFAGWYDDTRFVVGSGRTVRVVDVTTGRVVTEKQLAPAGQTLIGVWLAPLTGPLPPGAIVV
jgi:hypothetical protein